MEIVNLKVKDESGIRVHKKALDTDDLDFVNWIAAQYGEVNNSQVTIEALDGTVLGFTGEAPF